MGERKRGRKSKPLEEPKVWRPSYLKNVGKPEAVTVIEEKDVFDDVREKAVKLELNSQQSKQLVEIYRAIFNAFGNHGLSVDTFFKVVNELKDRLSSEKLEKWMNQLKEQYTWCSYIYNQQQEQPASVIQAIRLTLENEQVKGFNARGLGDGRRSRINNH